MPPQKKCVFPKKRGCCCWGATTKNMVIHHPKKTQRWFELGKDRGEATAASELLMVVLSRGGRMFGRSFLKIEEFWPFFPGGRLTQNESSQVIIAPIPLFNLVFFGWEGRWLVFYRFLRIFPRFLANLLANLRRPKNPRKIRKSNPQSSEKKPAVRLSHHFHLVEVGLSPRWCWIWWSCLVMRPKVRSVEPVVTHINLDWLSSQRPKQIEIQTSILSTACFQVDAYIYMYHTLRSIYERAWKVRIARPMHNCNTQSFLVTML